jgi:hypothetical protein
VYSSCSFSAEEGAVGGSESLDIRNFW